MDKYILLLTKRGAVTSPLTARCIIWQMKSTTLIFIGSPAVRSCCKGCFAASTLVVAHY